MKRFALTFALLLFAPAAYAQGVGAGYPNPSSTSPYALNNTNPSAGIVTPGSTYQSATQDLSIRGSSQFTSQGANTLYGNYGSGYAPELPSNVYNNDLKPASEAGETAAPASQQP